MEQDQVAPTDSTSRTSRLRGWPVAVALVLLGMMAMAVLSPLVFTVAVWRMDREYEKANAALWSLEYPEAPEGESALVRAVHLGRLRVLTGFVPLAIDREHTELFMEAMTAQEIAGRRRPQRTVTLHFVSSVAVMFPNEAEPSLVLSIQRRKYAIPPSSLRMVPSRAQREPQRSGVYFTVPTGLYLEWLREPVLGGVIGGHAFSVPEEHRRVLIEFAATLKPGEQGNRDGDS
jgi:hypothetical protein